MKPILFCLAVTGICLSATVAYAEDVDYIGLPAKEAAHLAARDAELDAVKAQVAALKAVIAAQEKQIEALEKLTALHEQETERQRRIIGLADEERDVYKDRAERLTRDAGKGNLWLRVQARAGAGALIGVAAAPLFPPAALLGPVVGGIAGLIESWIID